MASPVCGVYTITTPSGKKYVGSTNNFRNRKAVHLYGLRKGKHHSASLQAEYEQYGESALVFEVVEMCLPEELIEHEQKWLDAHDRVGLHNTGFVAGTCEGVVPNEDTRNKLAAKLRGNQRALGMKHTPEARAKMSQAAMGNQRRLGSEVSDETRAALSASVSATKSSSGFNGVSWENSSGKWLGRTRVAGKRVSVGRFATPQEAHEAIRKFVESKNG